MWLERPTYYPVYMGEKTQTLLDAPSVFHEAWYDTPFLKLVRFHSQLCLPNKNVWIGRNEADYTTVPDKKNFRSI